MTSKTVITVNFYIGTPEKANDQLKKSYALHKVTEEWAIRVLLDELAQELNYISGYGIWSIQIKSPDITFLVNYKNQFTPCPSYEHFWFWDTLRFEIGRYTGYRGGNVRLEIPRVNLEEGENLFSIKRYSVGKRKKIKRRGTMYTLHYDRTDSIFTTFHQKLLDGILSPNIQKEWQPYPSNRYIVSWWELPKTQTSQYRWDKRRKQAKSEAKKQAKLAKEREKLEKEGVVYTDKTKRKKAQQVYLVRVNHESLSDVYKIGISNAPGKRLKTLNTSNPFELGILHKFVAEPAEEAENKLHKRFHETRLSGEWFRLTPEQITEICNITGYINGKFFTEQDEIPFELGKMQHTDTLPKIINYKGVELMAIQNFGLGFNAKELNLEDILWLYDHNKNHEDVYTVTLTGSVSGNLLDFKEAKKFMASIKFGQWNATTMQCVDEIMKRFNLSESSST